MKILTRLVVMTLSLSCNAHSGVNINSAEKYYIYSNQHKGSLQERWLVAVYSELYSRLGIDIEIVSLPEKRASYDVEIGRIDGQFGRIYSYQDIYPHQIRVNEPIYNISIQAYVLNGYELSLDNGWESFWQYSNRVDYRRGVVLSQKMLEAQGIKELYAVSTVEQGLNKLIKNRTDVFVHANLGVDPFISVPPYRDQIVSAGQIDAQAMYHYVSDRHALIVDLLEKEIKNMKTSGLLKEYCLDIFGIEEKNYCLLLVGK